MRIRRKAPKPSRSHPLFVLGHAGPFPTPSEIQSWFDLEYGGPLRVQTKPPSMLASHGPWAAALQPLTETDAAAWREGLGWDHPAAAMLLPTAGQPMDRVDQVLHAARLARGVTLLSEGTSYDVHSQEYLNPSDWRDRPLTHFTVRDHVRISQSESTDTAKEWFSTRGLAKFGLDELEVFRPIGLSAGPVIETLLDLAEVLIRRGQMPSVGSTIPLPELQLQMVVVRHRTAQEGPVTLSLREIGWSPLSPQT